MKHPGYTYARWPDGCVGAVKKPTLLSAFEIVPVEITHEEFLQATTAMDAWLINKLLKEMRQRSKP